MSEVILVKDGELALKGLNRSSFEQVMIKNIRRAIKPIGEADIFSSQSTTRIHPRDGASVDDFFDTISRVFGISALSRACECEKDIGAICRCAAEYLADGLEGVSTFKVESKRSDKSFPMTSLEISSAVGEHLLDSFPHLTVDVHEPEMTVRVEVRDRCAYVHGKPVPGAGGLPVGTGGKAAVMISGGIDSPVAAWMMAKRGIELTAIHFASPPYTSERAEQKVHDLIGKVSEWAGTVVLYVVPFTELQEKIRDCCPEELFTVIMRRYMIRVAEIIARENGCQALISGESLGQVASQTLGALVCTDAAAQMPVLRPLIGMDKEEIIRISRRIDTFDISIQPFEDCCTVFTPKHPRTRPTEAEIIEAEKLLGNVDELVERAARQASHTWIAPWRNQ